MPDALTLEPDVKAPDTVTLEDFETAARLIVDLGNSPPDSTLVAGPVGQVKLRRVFERLVEKLERHFRDHDRLDTESQAVSVIREVATKLGAAGQSLLLAAEVLRNVGKGHQAAQAFQAGKAAQKAAAQYLEE